MSHEHKPARIGHRINQPEWKRDYQEGLKRGFSVDDMHQFSGDGNGGNLRVWMDLATPFHHKGVPVIGYGTVNLRGKREASDMEFWIRDDTGKERNLEDVLQGVSPEFTTADGTFVSERDARDQMGAFLTAASQYPHVFTYPEFVEARTPLNRRLGLEPPSPGDYEGYLKRTEREIRSGDVTYVGRITSAKDMVQAYASMPSGDTAERGPGLDTGYELD